MPVILDACAMIAFLRDEPGAEQVEAFFRHDHCMAHAVNVCEVYYDFFRAENEATAKNAVTDLVALGLKIKEDMDQPFWQEIGRLKAEIKRISLADCFAVALAKRINASIVTSDHHEFDSIAESGLCKILFIR